MYDPERFLKGVRLDRSASDSEDMVLGPDRRYAQASADFPGPSLPDIDF